MRRAAVPLYKSRHAAFVDAIQDSDDNDSSMASHLAVGTGARPYTISHTHKSWFIYQDGSLYYRIPSSDPCRKYGDHDPCGDCNLYDYDEYSPKTPAGAGRRILVKNEWTNPVTREREYFGLRDHVEDYFALDGDGAPDDVQYGNAMLKGKGVSKDQLSTWVRSIGAESDISARLREDRLRDELTIEEDRDKPQIVDFGTDSDGNSIPDLFTHDMRATFITHLMRNDVPRSKAITKTGHAVPDSMNPYVSFAEGEIDAREEDTFY